MDFHRAIIAEFDQELLATRKILAAVPVDVDWGWKPHAKSFTIGRLAGHVAETPCDWAIHTLTTDKLEWSPGEDQPYRPESIQAVLEMFDRESPKARETLASLDQAKWDTNWKMVAGGETWIDDTRYNVWRHWVVNHMIHHRAQLGVYLRLLNVKVPGTYGPSADEM